MNARKAGRKHLVKVANSCLGMVMKEKRSGEVTRREQIALAFGIAMGMFVCANDGFEFSGDALHDAAKLVMCSMDVLPDFRDSRMEMLEKGVPAVEMAVVLGRGEGGR